MPTKDLALTPFLVTLVLAAACAVSDGSLEDELTARDGELGEAGPGDEPGVLECAEERAGTLTLHYPGWSCEDAIASAEADLGVWAFRNACHLQVGSDLATPVEQAVVVDCRTKDPGFPGGPVVDVELCCPPPELDCAEAHQATASSLHYPGWTCEDAIANAEASLSSWHYRKACNQQVGSDLASPAQQAVVVDCRIDDPGFPGGPVVDVELCCTPPSLPCDDDLDIVFVLDSSTSMGFFHEVFAAQVLAVDAEIQALGLPNPPHYGLALFVDDALLLNGGAPYTDASALLSDFSTWHAITGLNWQLSGSNSNVTWVENSLDALHLAATGFEWRPLDTTTRLVIHATDDGFWDGPTVGNDVPIAHGYAETVQALQAANAQVHAFAAEIGGECSCLDVTPGWFDDYQGMPSIPMATGGSALAVGGVASGAVPLTQAIANIIVKSHCQSEL